MSGNVVAQLPKDVGSAGLLRDLMLQLGPRTQFRVVVAQEDVTAEVRCAVRSDGSLRWMGEHCELTVVLIHNTRPRGVSLTIAQDNDVAGYQTYQRPVKKRRLRSKSHPDMASLQKYVLDLAQEDRENPGRRASWWGMRLPAALIEPTFCRECCLVTSCFGAMLNEWKYDNYDGELGDEDAWVCGNCHQEVPEIHCARCEYPLWAGSDDFDDHNLRPQDDDEIWCPPCSLYYSGNYTAG